jgi:hypothetical protein
VRIARSNRVADLLPLIADVRKAVAQPRPATIVRVP